MAGTVCNAAMMTTSGRVLSEKLDVLRLTFYTAPVSCLCLLPWYLWQEVHCPLTVCSVGVALPADMSNHLCAVSCGAHASSHSILQGLRSACCSPYAQARTAVCPVLPARRNPAQSPKPCCAPDRRTG